MPLDIDTDLAMETSIVGIRSSSGGNVPGLGVWADGVFSFPIGDPTGSADLRGESIGEDGVVDPLLSEFVRSSRVLMVSVFGFCCGLWADVLRLIISQLGSFMPVYVRTGSILWMRSGSSSDPLEVEERKDVTEGCVRWGGCTSSWLSTMSVFWLFSAGDLSLDGCLTID